MIGSSAGTVVISVFVMGAVVIKAVDLVKYLVAGLRLSTTDRVRVNRLPADRREAATEARAGALSEAVNGLVTLVLTAGVGIGVAFAMARTTWIRQVRLGGVLLRYLPGTSLVLLGLAIAAVAAVIFDLKKALDRTDSASTPKLTSTADRARRLRIAAALGQVEQEERIERTIDEAIHRDVEQALAAFRGEPAAGVGPTEHR